MKTKIDIILRGGPPYGFRIQGGKEFGSKVRIAKIEPNSKASQCDMKINDLILFINTVSTSSILHTQALALLRAPSQFVTIVLERDDEYVEPINNNQIIQDNSNLSLKKASNNESNASVSTMETASSSPTNDGSNFRRNSFGRNSDWYKKMFKELHVVGTDDHHLKNLVDKDSNNSNLIVDRNSSNLRRQRSQSVSDLTDIFKEKLSLTNVPLKNKDFNKDIEKTNKSIEDIKASLAFDLNEDRIKNKSIHSSSNKTSPVKDLEVNHETQKSTYIDFHNRQIYDMEVAKKELSTSLNENDIKNNFNQVMNTKQNQSQPAHKSNTVLEPVFDKRTELNDTKPKTYIDTVNNSKPIIQKKTTSCVSNNDDDDDDYNKKNSSLATTALLATTVASSNVAPTSKLDSKDQLKYSSGSNILNKTNEIVIQPTNETTLPSKSVNVNKISTTQEPNKIIKCLFKVTSLYKFNGINERELSFNKNDVISVVEIIDENWYMGKLGNVSGIFPKCYVKKIEEVEKNDNPPQYNKQPISSYDHIALYNYQPKQNDEIKLVKGCRVKVIQKYADGWFKGSKEFDEKIGMFPGNFVSKIL